tara:strand:- start:66 stop:461 length:396 start_codon:yes stop_codon:yes gene_type:complete
LAPSGQEAVDKAIAEARHATHDHIGSFEFHDLIEVVDRSCTLHCNRRLNQVFETLSVPTVRGIPNFHEDRASNSRLQVEILPKNAFVDLQSLLLIEAFRPVGASPRYRGIHSQKWPFCEWHPNFWIEIEAG